MFVDKPEILLPAFCTALGEERAQQIFALTLQHGSLPRPAIPSVVIVNAPVSASA